MTKIGGVCLFLAGVAVGAVGGHYISSNRVKDWLTGLAKKAHGEDEQDEEESDESSDENTAEIIEMKPRGEKMDILEYAAQLKGRDYVNYATSSDEPIEKNNVFDEAVTPEPFVISPTELGMKDGYDVVSLLYFRDEILVSDEDGEVMDDIKGTVGLDSLKHFGEYEDDSVCVRNDILKTDYEILLDQRTYKEALEDEPNHFLK